MSRPFSYFPLQFVNETDAMVLVYRVNPWEVQRFLEIKPGDTKCNYSLLPNETFLFSNRKKEPLMFSTGSTLSFPSSSQCFFGTSTNERLSNRLEPLVVRILSPSERTLKDLCIQTVADRLVKSKSRTDSLPIPKWLKSHFATKSSSKVEKLCLPRHLKTELKLAVDPLVDYARAKDLIENASLKHGFHYQA